MTKETWDKHNKYPTEYLGKHRVKTYMVQVGNKNNFFGPPETFFVDGLENLRQTIISGKYSSWYAVDEDGIPVSKNLIERNE